MTLAHDTEHYDTMHSFWGAALSHMAAVFFFAVQRTMSVASLASRGFFCTVCTRFKGFLRVTQILPGAMALTETR